MTFTLRNPNVDTAPTGVNFNDPLPAGLIKGGNCSPAAPGPFSPGLAAWGTTTHNPAALGLTETPFTPATLTPAELTRITNYCGFINANGSGYGTCRSCRAGALGGIKQ